jgi:hypothetical protein
MLKKLNHSTSIYFPVLPPLMLPITIPYHLNRIPDTEPDTDYYPGPSLLNTQNAYLPTTIVTGYKSSDGMSETHDINNIMTRC